MTATTSTYTDLRSIAAYKQKISYQKHNQLGANDDYLKERIDNITTDIIFYLPCDTVQGFKDRGFVFPYWFYHVDCRDGKYKHL